MPRTPPTPRMRGITPDEGPSPLLPEAGTSPGSGEYLVGRGVPRKSTGVRGPGQVSLSPHPRPKPGSRSVLGPPSLLLGCRALEVTGAQAQMAPPPPGVSLPARESEGTGRSS